MFKRFYPKEVYNSTYTIDFSRYYAAGYRGVIFDIDNTLVEHDAPADARAKALIADLKALGFRVLFLSNNDEERVKSFNDEVDALYLHKAGKPLAKGYKKAMEMMETDENTTLFVGDQIFTDIWGANNAGIHSILVKPIAKHEEIQIVLKRIPEKWVLASYRAYRKRLKKKKESQ